MKQPPANRLKTIKYGAMTGMSDINPQWRYEVMTEVFGMCGVGWWYTIDSLFERECPNGEVMAFARVTVYTAESNGIGIPAVGGSGLVQMQKGELRNNDEAYKMAVTDALGTALKMLGVAADIYAGKWDGSKYKEDAPEVKTSVEVKPSVPVQVKAGLIDAKYFEENIKPLAERMYVFKPNGEEAYKKLLAKFKVTRAANLTTEDAPKFVEELRDTLATFEKDKQ